MLALMETVSVRFRDCACPGTPHPDGDVAELRPYLDYAGGAEALAVMQELGDGLVDPSKLGPALGPVFIRRGVVGWNLLDEDGKPVPCTPEALDALRWEDAYELGDRADDLYGGQVLDPLVKRMRESSKNGPTVASIQPRPKRSQKPRKRSRPSSSRS